jgi:diguanylate cyclase (GGDEF)-like protein
MSARSEPVRRLHLVGGEIVPVPGRFAHAARAIASLRSRVSRAHGVRGPEPGSAAGRAPARQLRVPLTEFDANRYHQRASTLRIGEVLGATHDSEQLRRVLVETAVEATGATCGALLDRGRRLDIGEVRGADQIEQRLESRDAFFGTLVLVGDAFDDQARELAELLARQGGVALENARLHQVVQLQAVRDELTGLPNRRRAQHVLDEELRRAERLGGSLGFVLADLDDFKAVNDTHGHPIGDAVLVAFAAAIRSAVREIDQAARWGGEEFAILLPGTDTAGAAIVAERIRRAFASCPIMSGRGEPLFVTASFGAAAYPDVPSKDQLVAAADATLYAAKRSGKNRVVTSACATSRARELERDDGDGPTPPEELYHAVLPLSHEA